MHYPAGSYMFKVNDRNTRTKVWNIFKVNYKATKTTPWCRFGGFIVNYEHISHLCSSVSIVNFKQVNAGWVIVCFYICLKNASTEHLPPYFFSEPLWSMLSISYKHLDTHLDVEIKRQTFYTVYNVFVWNHSLQHASKT